MTDIIYAPLLGQSNARNMNNFVGDDEAGYTRLVDGLEQLTGLTVVSGVDDPTGDPVSLSVGGSAIDGDNTEVADSKVWWYPDTDQPGGALLRALGIMQEQYADLAAEGDVKITLVWSQGEHSAEVLANRNPEQHPELIARYKAATESVFDYLEAQMGVDIDFYIMQTGEFHAEGAVNEGLSVDYIERVQEGTEAIAQAQEELAASREDIHLAVNYNDLAMAYESGLESKTTDKWHLDADSYEIIGTRLAEFIAEDLGFGGSVSNPNYFTGTDLADTLKGTSEDDTLTGGDGNDNLRGQAGKDYILGGEGADFIRGESGNDIIVSGAGNDRSYGGEGDDAIIGEAGDDLLVGNAGNDFLLAGDGADLLRGEAGDDFLSGGAGKDRLIGGDGADSFRFSLLTDSVRQGASQDFISDFEVGIDTIDLSGLGFTGLTTGMGDGGELRVHYTSSNNRTYMRDDSGSDFEFYLQGDYRTTLAESDIIFGGEQTSIEGTEGADTLTGSSSSEFIKGFGGDDVIETGGGNDTLNGGAGKDVINAGSGVDTIIFSSLTDSQDDNGANNNQFDVIANFDASEDRFDLSGLGFTGLAESGATEGGELRIAYSSGSDRTYVRSDQLDFEFYLEGDYSGDLTDEDFIFGEQTNQIVGTNAAETLTGDAENDAIHGLDEDDELDAGAGADVLDGGAGEDKLTGGDGADIFRFSHTDDSVRGNASSGTFDRITDFEVGVDQIDLSALGFTGITTGSADAGELRIVYSNNSDRTYVRDDSGSDFEFYLDGNYTGTITNADFIF